MANLRFYTHSALTVGASVQLSESAAAHATRALRLNVGDDAILFNGDGFNYSCTLTEIKKSSVTAIVKSVTAVHNESPLNITLVQAISSGDRMDFTIQKAVELGVKNIQPISSKRSVVKLSGERAENAPNTGKILPFQRASNPAAPMCPGYSLRHHLNSG